MLRDAWYVLKKDLLIEGRSKEIVFTMVTFGILSVVIFALSFYIDEDKARAYGPGILWVVILFGGTLGLQRLFQPERDNDCLGGLLLTPMDPRSLFLGKFLLQLCFCLVMELLTIPLILMFFDLFRTLEGGAGWTFTLIVLLGTIGFSTVGTLFAALLLNTRLREVLVPVVVYPLVTPVLIAGVQSTRDLFGGAGLADVQSYLTLLGAYALIYLAVCLLLFPVLIRE